MGLLADLEVDTLIRLADQIAGWSEFGARSISDRKKFVTNACNSNLPSFLLKLLKSQFVKNRYTEEYNKLLGVDEDELYAVIASLYVSHIGDRMSVSFISNVFNTDFGGLLARFDAAGNGLRLLRIRGKFVETVPSIGATNILSDVVPDKTIVGSVVKMLAALSESARNDDFSRHIFSQMMRYSIIRPVVSDKKWITRFFDNISRIETIRRQILFWLQWSIALREQGAFSDAEKKLEQAYREAELYERRRNISYDRRQLDDVKAKFLVARARGASFDQGHLFQDVQAAAEMDARINLARLMIS
jgi:hypothetical protein